MKRAFLHQNRKILFLLLIISYLSSLACKKLTDSSENSSSTKGNLSLQNAKIYFTSLVNEEKKEETLLKVQTLSSKKAKNVVKNISVTKPIGRFEKLNKVIQWQSMSSFTYKGVNYIVVPVVDSVKDFKNVDFFRSLIFYKKETSNIELSILEMINTKAESLGKDHQEASSNAFRNKYFSEHQKIDALNASVIFYDQKYVRDTSFQIITGNWSNARISLRSDLIIK